MCERQKWSAETRLFYYLWHSFQFVKERGEMGIKGQEPEIVIVLTLWHTSPQPWASKIVWRQKSYINLSQSSNTLDTQGNIDKTATTCFLLTCLNCNNLIWWTLDTCEAHTLQTVTPLQPNLFKSVHLRAPNLYQVYNRTKHCLLRSHKLDTCLATTLAVTRSISW